VPYWQAVWGVTFKICIIFGVFIFVQVYHSMLDATRQIVMKERFLGLYRGLVPTLIQIAPQTGLQFAFYSLFSHLWISFTVAWTAPQEQSSIGQSVTVLAGTETAVINTSCSLKCTSAQYTLLTVLYTCHTCYTKALPFLSISLGGSEKSRLDRYRRWLWKESAVCFCYRTGAASDTSS